MTDEALDQSNNETDISIDDCWNRIGVWGNEEPRCPKLDEVFHCTNCNIYSEAGRRLLDRPAQSDYLEEWTDQLGQAQQAEDRESTSVVVFRLGDEWLALSTRLFQEVMEMRVVHRVPHTRSPVLKGLVNVRGELQLCVSLGYLLGIDRRNTRASRGEKEGYNRLVVVANGEHRYVFPVTEVRGIRRYARREIQTVPATASHATTNYMKGMLVAEDQHIGCIDDELLMAALERALS